MTKLVDTNLSTAASTVGSCFRLVTGMHRSGTTVLGRMLGAFPHTKILHEPFNRDYGCEGVPFVYPLIDEIPTSDQEIAARLLDDVLALRATGKAIAPGDSWTKAIARRLTGGRFAVNQLNARTALYARKDLKLIIKDPFLLLAVPYLTHRYHVKTVVIVRHPCAVWMSMRRMAWNFDFSHFAKHFCAEEHVATCGQTLAELTRASPAERFSALWSILAQSSLNYADSSSLVRIVTHESLCDRPTQIVSDVTKHFDIEASQRALQRVRKLTSGTTVLPTDATLHHLSRNSRALVGAWRSQIDTCHERIIRDKTEPLVLRLYGSW